MTDLALSSSKIRATMSSIERRGRWVVPRDLSISVLWGNAHVDLREAVLPSEGATIDVRVAMGNLEIVVPPNLPVEVAIQTIAGNVEDKRTSIAPTGEASTDPYRAAPQPPRVRIVGVVKLGNCEVIERAHDQPARALSKANSHEPSDAGLASWWWKSSLRNQIYTWLAVTLAAGVWVGVKLWHAVGWEHAAIASLGLSVVSAVVAWRITRPLLMVIRAAQKIGDGDLTTRLTPPAGDEMRLLANTINDMADKLQRQMNDQRQLLAAVSHELRTPLGHMRVLIETARDAGDRRSLNELEREVLVLDDLVGKLLASSRLEFGNLERRPVDLGELAADTATAAGLAPDIVEAQGDVVVAVDPTLVRRALANLIDNARVHGGGAIAVRIERRGVQTAIEVDDAGPGFPSERRADAFTAFVPSSGAGLGLGLAIVSRIAHAHGGTAYINDRPGGGARVGFTVARDSGGIA